GHVAIHVTRAEDLDGFGLLARFDADDAALAGLPKPQRTAARDELLRLYGRGDRALERDDALEVLDIRDGVQRRDLRLRVRDDPPDTRVVRRKRPRAFCFGEGGL